MQLHESPYLPGRKKGAPSPFPPAPCKHDSCTVVRVNWDGSPAIVRCDKCGATNYLKASR